jgi:hypothetical protein
MFLWSMPTMMALGLVPLANAARDRRTAPVSPLIALACAAIVLVFSVAMRDEVTRWARAVLVSAAVLASFMLTLCFMFRIIYRFTPRAWALAVAWMGLSWLVPIVIDYARYAVNSFNEDYHFAQFAAASPIGALTMAWNESDERIWPGLLFQAGCAGAWAALYYLTRRRPRIAQTTVPIGTTDGDRGSRHRERITS